jgi:hypothetical protein
LYRNFDAPQIMSLDQNFMGGKKNFQPLFFVVDSGFREGELIKGQRDCAAW